MYYLLCRELSNDGVVGVARGTVFPELRRGAGFKTGDFVKEKLGWDTAKRLKISSLDEV